MRGLLSAIIDFIIPPRPSERLVRELSADALAARDHEDGLPYHDPAVTALIWELKYYGSRTAAALAGEFLAEKLLAAAAEELGRPLIIPIPMHPARRKERGHNQTELLCEALLHEIQGSSPVGKKVWLRRSRPEDFFSGRAAALDYQPQALKRVVNTATQQGLERTARLKNVRGSMAADPKLVKGRACIVVDDVTTTGATFAEAKRALREAGARSVETIALARS